MYIKENEKYSSILKSIKKFHIDEVYPYKEIKLDEIVDKFLKSLKVGNDEFSWLKEFNVDLSKENKSANIHYGIPTHVHGNYKDGIIYLCLFNPSVSGIDDKVLTDVGIKGYYNSKTINDYMKNNGIDSEVNNESDKIRKSLEEWLKGNESINQEELNNKICKYIISSEESILTREIKEIAPFIKNEYYTYNYLREVLKLPKLLISTKEKNYRTANKVVNLELVPFRTKEKSDNFNGYTDEKISIFGAYIIWYRIGKYLRSKKIEERPKFIFRSFDIDGLSWKKLLKKSLSYIVDNKDKHLIDDFIYDLFGEFFFSYTGNGRNAILSDNNLVYFDENKEKKKISNQQFNYLVELLNVEKNNWFMLINI